MTTNPIPFTVALQDSPETSINQAATTDLSTVNANLVHIVYTGTTINSLGTQPNTTWNIRFDAGVKLHHNPPVLTLIGAVDRTTVANDRGTYRSDANGNVTEIGYSSGTMADLTSLQAQITTLTNWMNTVINTGLTTSGFVNATGNITGSTITGSQLTSTGNVSAVNGSYSGTVTVTSTITGGTLTSNGNVNATSGTVSATNVAASNNVNGAVSVSAGTGANINASGAINCTGTVSAVTGSFSGNISAVNVTASSNVQGANCVATSNVLSYGDLYVNYTAASQTRFNTHTHFVQASVNANTNAPNEPS